MTLSIILICLVFSAFFSGMEIAFVASNRLRIELDRKQGKISSSIISIFIKNPTQYIATMLIGNNIALVVYGIFMAILLKPFILFLTQSEFWILILQTIISTIIILTTAEFLPKSLFRIDPNRSLNLFAFPVFICYIVLYPVAVFTIALSNIIIHRRFQIDNKQMQLVFGKVDLDNLIQENERESSSYTGGPDMKIFKKALDFSHVRLRECMVPRTEMATLEVNEGIEMLKQKFIETGFSKILIFQDSIDNFLGYVHSSDLFPNPQSIRPILRTLVIVPETMQANKMLATFIKEHKSMALIVDEFGGTSGLVTIEDIIEEIFGEILDEHDSPEWIEKQINKGEFIFSGRLEIDHVNDKYQLQIPHSDQYETIAGFILYHHEKFPIVNEEITIGNHNFKILKATHTKIDLVKLTLLTFE